MTRNELEARIAEEEQVLAQTTTGRRPPEDARRAEVALKVLKGRLREGSASPMRSDEQAILR